MAKYKLCKIINPFLGFQCSLKTITIIFELRTGWEFPTVLVDIASFREPFAQCLSCLSIVIWLL